MAVARPLGPPFGLNKRGVVNQMKVITALAALLAAGVTTQATAQGRGRGQEQHPQQPVPQQEQQRRVQQEQQRTTQFRQSYPQREQQLQQHTAVIQKQAQRPAQAKAQQDYLQRMQAQRARQVQVQRDYVHEPYVTTPHTFRYIISGAPRETNQFGVDILRQAVNYGYQEGYAAGRADRLDRYRFSYANNPAYLDANYGYSGAYIDQGDYNYYFRQGFVKGYNDGFYSRFQYGSLVNGNAAILGSVLTGILGLVTLH